MTTINRFSSSSQKQLYRNIAFIILAVFVVLFAFDLLTHFIQCSEIRAYYDKLNAEARESYSRYYSYTYSEEEINDMLPDYSLSRLLMILVQNIPFTILMVYCFFFYNRYAGKYIYLLTTGAGAWASLIYSVMLLLSSNSPLSYSDDALVIIATILQIIYTLLMCAMWLALFLGKVVISNEKLQKLAPILPFVLCGLSGLILILNLCQIQEFNYLGWSALFSGLGRIAFLFTFHLLWNAETTHNAGVIRRQHGAYDLYNNLRQLHINASNGNMTPAEFEQQKGTLLNTFCHTAPIAAPAVAAQPASAPAASNAPQVNGSNVWVCNQCGSTNPVHRASCSQCGFFK